MRDINDLSTRDLWAIVAVMTVVVIVLAFGLVQVSDHFESEYVERCNRAGLMKAEVAHDFLCADPSTGQLFLPPKE